MCGKVKVERPEPKRKRVLIGRKIKSHAVDPKRDELHMTRLKRP